MQGVQTGTTSPAEPSVASRVVGRGPSVLQVLQVSPLSIQCRGSPRPSLTRTPAGPHPLPSLCFLGSLSCPSLLAPLWSEPEPRPQPLLPLAAQTPREVESTPSPGHRCEPLTCHLGKRHRGPMGLYLPALSGGFWVMEISFRAPVWVGVLAQPASSAPLNP